MSMPTMTVQQACDHGRYEKHPLGWLSPELIEPDFECAEVPDEMGGYHCWCPGGKEITLRMEEVDLAPDKEYPKWRHVWLVEVDGNE